jgi:alpha-glucosidase
VSLALCGVSNSGHDIGGFAGPAPEAELFLRWVQHGIFLPRFSIHSWNDDHSVNEPWMYPEITPHIRELIKFRYRLIPYLYDLLWRSHQHYEPMIRPTFYDFPQDPQCFEENDEMMLGGKLLIASVVEPGKRERAVYLPQGCDWVDFWSGDRFQGGQTITLPAPWDKPPLLVREGSAIPLNLAQQHFAQAADQRGFALFPPGAEGEFSDEFFEDDGESENYRNGDYGLWKIHLAADASCLAVSLTYSGPYPSAASEVTVLLPRQETRSLQTPTARIIADQVTGEWREVRLSLA